MGLPVTGCTPDDIRTAIKIQSTFQRLRESCLLLNVDYYDPYDPVKCSPPPLCFICVIHINFMQDLCLSSAERGEPRQF